MVPARLVAGGLFNHEFGEDGGMAACPVFAYNIVRLEGQGVVRAGLQAPSPDACRL